MFLPLSVEMHRERQNRERQKSRGRQAIAMFCSCSTRWKIGNRETAQETARGIASLRHQIAGLIDGNMSLIFVSYKAGDGYMIEGIR
jgi:hypothetical protein